MPKTHEEILQQKRDYYHKNKVEINEKRKDYSKKYNKENKEKMKEYHNIYSKTEKGIKVNMTGKWKTRGLKGDYDEIYERYINTYECDNCGIELNQDESTKKCMDHDHCNGAFRNILCKSCNNKRG